MKGRIFHTRDKCRGCIAFPFNVSDAARSWHGNPDAEFEPSNPGT